MGRAPAVIIIARHGARLDAEDSSWITKSPHPYDPPLTYGGWAQTRALGARIGSLLRQRDVTLNTARKPTRRGSEDIGLKDTDQLDAPITTSKHRKHKVVIHSSPFLRCVQSSIAICAGMAQYQGNLAKFENAQTSKVNAKPPKATAGPSRSRTLDANAFESSYASSTSTSKNASDASTKNVQSQFIKPTVRIDACLGEWLSPDYFEGFSAPPSSKVMIAGAKADILRPATPLQGVIKNEQSGQNKFSKPDADVQLDGNPENFFSLQRVSDALSGEEQPTESSSVNGQTEKENHSYSLHKILSRGYQPPVPNYAISTSNPIPPGFVAHARDACAQIDYQWDSMEAPQSWGDGGEYGEEWSSMHKRFRKGLMDMITWYKQSGPYLDPQADAAHSGEDERMDDDEDIVLVLVTHGAGCNALIGALTNQPVLLDVGMGSLTMAVHKESRFSTPGLQRINSNSTRRRSSVDCSQADEYEMKIVASTDHLRAGNDPLKIPQLQSPALLASISESGSRTSPPRSGASTPGGNARSKNSALGSVRRHRAITTSGGKTLSYERVLLSPSSTGLWSSRQSSAHSGYQSPIDEEDIESFSLDSQPRQNSAVTQSASTDSASPANPSPKGLWGAAPRKAPARRWTVNEHN